MYTISIFGKCGIDKHNEFYQHERKVALKLAQNLLKRRITNLVLLAFFYFVVMAAFTVGYFSVNTLQQLSQFLRMK